MAWQVLFPYILVGLQVLQVVVVGLDHWWHEIRPQRRVAYAIPAKRRPSIVNR